MYLAKRKGNILMIKFRIPINSDYILKKSLFTISH